MANLYDNPIILDTDITSFRTATGYANGIRPSKLILSVGSAASSAGTVTITRPADGAKIYPVLNVAATTAANTELFIDDPVHALLNWNDFAITGLTATGTVIYIWYN